MTIDYGEAKSKEQPRNKQQRVQNTTNSIAGAYCSLCGQVLTETYFADAREWYTDVHDMRGCFRFLRERIENLENQLNDN